MGGPGCRRSDVCDPRRLLRVPFPLLDPPEVPPARPLLSLLLFPDAGDARGPRNEPSWPPACLLHDVPRGRGAARPAPLRVERDRAGVTPTALREERRERTGVAPPVELAISLSEPELEKT